MSHQPDARMQSAPARSKAEQRQPCSSLCSCVDLHLSYGRHCVLDGCDLSVLPREVVGLTGENGSGKSTLVKCLLGFLRPLAGQVHCDARVGYCPQENYLHRSYTVAEHFELISSLRPGGRPVDADFLGHCIVTRQHPVSSSHSSAAIEGLQGSVGSRR